MVIIRFPDLETKRRALGFLARRYSGKSWATGEVMVPDAALAPLAAEGIRFTVEGPANFSTSSRNASKSASDKSTSG